MPHAPRGRAWRIVAWSTVALMGLIVAAAISLAASRLSSQHIGLSPEPPSVTRTLSPGDPSNAGSRHRSGRAAPPPAHTTPTQTAPAGGDDGVGGNGQGDD